MHIVQRSKRVLFAGVLLLAATAAASLSSGKAFAAFTVCRTDPTVTLSDGHVIVMHADIGTDISNVQNVTYTLHIPRGIYATSIQYDSTGYLETVNVVSDQYWGHGYTDTVVTTNTATPVSVTAYSAIQGVVSGTNSGLSGQHLDLYY